MDGAVTVPLSRHVVAEGKSAVVLPCTNPALAPVLDVTGFPGRGGWLVRISDAAGAVLCSIMITGMEETNG